MRWDYYFLSDKPFPAKSSTQFRYNLSCYSPYQRFKFKHLRTSIVVDNLVPFVIVHYNCIYFPVFSLLEIFYYSVKYTVGYFLLIFEEV